MNRNTAVTVWREVCGSDTVMAMGVVTGGLLEAFASRIEAAERERCAKLCELAENVNENWRGQGDYCARQIREPA